MSEFPRYELLAPFYAPNDTLFPEGFELEFDGTPNEFMRPLNEAARKKMAEYMPSVDKRPLDVQLHAAREAEKNKPVAVIPHPVVVTDRKAPHMPNPAHNPRAALVGEAKAPDDSGGLKKRGRPKKMFGSVIQESHGEARSSLGGYSE